MTPTPPLNYQLSKDQLPGILSLVEKEAVNCGLDRREALSLTLAAEEVFAYLCEVSDAGQAVKITFDCNDYKLRLHFHFPESGFDFRAFNLTYKACFDEQDSACTIGLLLASRSVDRLHLTREQPHVLRLTMVKEKAYATQPPLTGDNLAASSDCEPGIATPAETELFARLALKHLDLGLLPPFFSQPEKMRDMVASGDYCCAVAVSPDGRQAGGMFWQRHHRNTLECFGPYLFERQEDKESRGFRAGLLHLCLTDLSKTPAVGMMNRYPGGSLSDLDFDELGSYSVYGNDGSGVTETIYFRQIHEDPGGKMWASHALEDFLLQEYRRLVLPREVEFLQPEDHTAESGHSVITASFQRDHNVAILRPLWPGFDIEENVNRHIQLLEAEGWKNISAEIDLGIPWQAAFTNALLQHGFTPRIVLPLAGQGDVVLFRRPGRLNSLVPDFVKSFEPYIPSQPGDVLKKKYHYDVLHHLNNNENGLGPPPAAEKALAGFSLKEAALYPSGDSYHLRMKLAELSGLHSDQFIVTNGANESITLLIKSFCEAGDNIVTADQTYGGYEWVARFSGFGARIVPLKEGAFDPDAMLAVRDDRTKVFFICNPNNPTGTYWSREQLVRFLEKAGPNCIVVLDEAYFEFVDQPDYPDGTTLINRYPNLVILRTFSKMYGLAGLRIGYLIGDIDVVNMIRRTAIVYSVNSMAQIGAQAALEDQGHIERTREMVAEGKELLLRELAPLGLELGYGEGNYMTVKLPFSDSLAYRMMMQQGVMVRMMTPFRFPNSIRITIAKRDAMLACIHALTTTVRERCD